MQLPATFDLTPLQGSKPLTVDKLSTLARLNPHPRDAFIKFDEPSHTYAITIPANQTQPTSVLIFSSVTTWNHCHFEQFDADLVIKKMRRGRNWATSKYFGMTDEQIKDMWNVNKDSASGAGTNMHASIEDFMNNPLIAYPYYHGQLYNDFFQKYQAQGAALLESNPTYKTKEWGYFLNYLRDMPGLKPYRTEWAVYHEEARIAGMIDMLYENPDGSLMIFDWKRSKVLDRSHKNDKFPKFATTRCIKHIIDSNFWHYSLQLNVYRYILQHKYGKIVNRMFLVVLHPNNVNNNYELAEVPILEQEMNDLFNMRITQLAAGIDMIAQNKQHAEMTKPKDHPIDMLPIETATGDELWMKMLTGSVKSMGINK